MRLKVKVIGQRSKVWCVDLCRFTQHDIMALHRSIILCNNTYKEDECINAQAFSSSYLKASYTIGFSLTGRVFFHRFPSLYEFLREHLEAATKDMG